MQEKVCTAYIMSAKFSPGHFSHLLALYKGIKRLGYEVSLCLESEYKSFIDAEEGYKHSYIGEIVNAPDILFIYNQSKDDAKYIKKFKKLNNNLKVYFVYHEPWLGLKAVLSNFATKKESLRETIKTIGRYLFVKRVLKESECVILPSKAALQQYERKCKRYNKNYAVFPLVFTDEAKGEVHCEEKKYFSFISTAAPSKNFRMFLNYVKYRSVKDSSTFFQIATKTDISAYLDDDLKVLISQNRLKVNHAHPLSNEEINRAYAQSNCTWMLYVRSTQSGVLCKAFMFGSPVIASTIGSFTEYVNEDNGVLLTDGYTLQDIDEAYNKVLQNLPEYSMSARATFLKEFYWENYVDSLKEILQ